MGLKQTNILTWRFELWSSRPILIRKLDSELVARKYNTIEIEERVVLVMKPHIAAANNEGNGNGMNIMGNESGDKHLAINSNPM